MRDGFVGQPRAGAGVVPEDDVLAECVIVFLRDPGISCETELGSMRGVFTSLVCCLCLFLLTTLDAHADKRVALVIGNGAYKNVPALPNPTHDATDVAAALKRSGFDVILATNLDQEGMQDAAIRFAREAREADVALFYYSGHALQFAGVNYLVPVDAVVRDEMDLRRLTRADEILADLQQAKNLRILVLDSCRDNPFADNLRRSAGKGRGVSVGRGLAKMESPEGTIISYATQAGRTANDGDGRNSPYTTAFLQHIADRDSINNVFQSISASVWAETKGSQIPELSLSFFGEYYLNGKPEKPASSSAALPADPCADAAEHWHSTEAVGTVEAYKDHLLRFPNCAFAGLAKSRIEELSKAAEVAKPANPYDGLWIVKETCTSKPPFFPAATFKYTLRIKDGALHEHFGEDGKPGSSTFDGQIGADGTADIAVAGLVNPARDPLHRPAGSQFKYDLALALKDSTGVAVRTRSFRPCRSELTKLSASADAVAVSKPFHEEDSTPVPPKTRAGTRNKATAAIEPTEREPAPAPSRQMEGGLSCSFMRGKCNAHCFARSGHPDCASRGCVRLERECLSSGCWRGRGFSSCGLARR